VSALDFAPLRTERLLLRRFREADLPALLAYRNDAGLARFQSWGVPFGEDEARAFIAEMQAAPLRATWSGLQIAVALAERDELVGDLYLGAGGDLRQAVLGYTLARAYHGRGYATEAARGLLAFVFGDLALHRVTATVDTRNTASVALLERLGMRREGQFLQAYYDEAYAEWTDEYQYALLRSEWQRQGQGDADAKA
jgi:RimJ/RimL family protein N-acetyltransferase